MSNTYAIIQNGKVSNIVIANVDYATKNGWVELLGDAGIGWDYINGQFVDNRPAPEVVTPAAPTKEQLLAQVQALTAKINALE